MMDFSLVKEFEIPEGSVTKVEVNGVTLWSAESSGGGGSEFDAYQRVEFIRTSGGSNGGYFLPTSK